MREFLFNIGYLIKFETFLIMPSYYLAGFMINKCKGGFMLRFIQSFKESYSVIFQALFIFNLYINSIFAASVELNFIDNVREDVTALFKRGESTKSSKLGSTTVGKFDLDGDGRIDLLFSAFGANGDDGLVYLFYGNVSTDSYWPTVNPDEDADIIIVGNDGEKAGTSLLAQDLNNDSYPELIIGASANSTNGVDAGAVYILDGKSLISSKGTQLIIDLADINDSISGIKILGENKKSKLGKSLAAISNFDDENLVKLLISSSGSNTGKGKVVGFNASELLTNNVNVDLSKTEADFEFTGSKKGNWFGGIVQNAGDVNGDGYNDLVASETGADPNGFNTGATYIIFGQSETIEGSNKVESLDNVLKIEGDEGIRLFFGRAIASNGNIDGDDKTDLLVVGTEYGQSSLCGAYLFTGESLTTAYASSDRTLQAQDADVKFYGEREGMTKASSVAFIEDRNDDNADEVVVGCKSKESGRAYIFSGGTLASAEYDLEEDADMLFVGSEISTYSKTYVTDLGDVTGDGKSDLMIGSSITNYDNSKGMAAVINTDLSELPQADVSTITLINDDYDSFFAKDLGWKRFSSTSYSKKYDYEKSPTTGWPCSATGKYAKCYATWTQWVLSSWDDGSVTKDADGHNVSEADFEGYVEWCSALIEAGVQPTLQRALAANSTVPDPNAGDKILYCPATK